MKKMSLFSMCALLLAVYTRGPAHGTTLLTVHGVVVGTYFTPPVGNTPSSTVASYFGNAKVCLDANNDSVCNAGESSTLTDTNGVFDLVVPVPGPLAAEISTASSNGGHAVTERNVFRVAAAQVVDGIASGQVVISPLSTEVVRLMEAGNISYSTARQNLAARLNLTPATLISDLSESVILSARFALAAKMVDRHDISPATLYADASATGPAITLREAQQAAMNLEDIPRYDHVFLIFLENRQTQTIKNSAFAPKINAYLNAGNQFTSYNATGNPSEPNYTAAGAGDDFGITDDSAWNCVPSGNTADLPEDLPLPPGVGACTNATVHNIKSRANLFNAMTAHGMTWRVYNESMNPNRDWRSNGVADATLLAPDHIYPANSPVGAIGNPNLNLRFASQLYATKHNPTMAFQNVRSAPEFVSSNRTMGGGQWDAAIKALYPSWDVDQLGTDLNNGNLANLNFLIPDQCDDMHGITVTGTIGTSQTTGTASDCSGNALIYRSDKYVDYLVQKIQASSIWTNSQKHVAVVIMFDEGTATSGLNSCCGWNPIGKPGYSTTIGPLGILVKNPNGSISVDTVVRYANGNKGHGTSVFGVLTNQSSAPKSVVDSDAYSHFSLVRTLQDMFGLADPGDDWSYMNRSKYTEKFIAANIQYVPEFAANIADPHFDGVRPMNHRYVIPASYAQKTGYVTPPGPQIGPDANQLNAWAVDFSNAKQWRQPPSTTVSASPLPNDVGWNNSPVTITLQGMDDAGGSDVTSMKYTTSGAQNGTETVAGNHATVEIHMEGQTTVSYFARNFLGAQSPEQSLTLNLDLTPPSVHFSGNASYTVDQNILITCAVQDPLSGLSSSTCPQASGPAYGFPLGANHLTAHASDRAGNESTVTATFTVGVTFESLSSLTETFVTQHGIANSLTATLSAAAKAAQRGDLNAKAGILNAFCNEVSAQTGKSIDAAQAEILIHLASAL